MKREGHYLFNSALKYKRAWWCSTWKHIIQAASTKENLKDLFFVHMLGIMCSIIKTIQSPHLLFLFSLSLFLFLSLCLNISFCPVSAGGERGVMLAQVLDCQNTHLLCIYMLGREETNVHRPHTHSQQHAHITKMYHSNCVNSNITLRPSTPPPLPFLSWPWCNYQGT